jgi:hypothetical protein
MPARLLAYGGTSFSERRRIGSWPSIPEATLRDAYALSPTAWSYGFGVLASQPFLIFRQKQNVEQRGGYPFSLLLDPGEAVWKRFDWNAASIVEAVLAADPDALFRSPDACSGDALEALMAGLRFVAPPARIGALAYVMVAGAGAAEPSLANFAERPSPAALASALAALPVCFRAGVGWLAGGGIAHGRAFGASVVFDEQATGSPDAVSVGRDRLEAWDAARQQGIVKDLDGTPLWSWGESPAAVMESVALLREIAAADSASDELVERASLAKALAAEVDEAIAGLLARGSRPLGAKQSAKLIRRALEGRKIEAGSVGRLHRDTLLAELKAFGSPPKAVPAALPLSREMRVDLWCEYLRGLMSGVPASLNEAFAQLGPGFSREEHTRLTHSAVGRLPYASGRLTEWSLFQKNPSTWPLIEGALREEALQQFASRAPGAAEAYLRLGNDPGGVLARDVLNTQALRTKLVEAVRSLRESYPELAQAWLDAIPKQSEPRRVPITRSAPVLTAEKAPEPVVESELVAMLRELLFSTNGWAVEEKSNAFERAVAGLEPDARSMFDAMVEENCAVHGKRFAGAFLGKYGPLGVVLGGVSEAARAKLIGCLAEAKDFIGIAERDLRHAYGSPGSRNAYTVALSQYLLNDARLLMKVGDQAPGGPATLKRKLMEMAKG